MAELRKASLLFLLLLAACSGLSALDAKTLENEQKRWDSAGPVNYHMQVEMSGDRLERSNYDVTVRDKLVVRLLRNGQPVVTADGGQDYSVSGLFHILEEELELVAKPVSLGAPPGFSSYPMAQFDPANGRLLHFQRSVGGTRNSIEIRVTEFEVLP